MQRDRGGGDCGFGFRGNLVGLEGGGFRVSRRGGGGARRGGQREFNIETEREFSLIDLMGRDGRLVNKPYWRNL